MSKLEMLTKEFNLENEDGILRSKITKDGIQIHAIEDIDNYIIIRITRGKKVIYSYSTKINQIDTIIKCINNILKG